jgi:hypothetical protein
MANHGTGNRSRNIGRADFAKLTAIVQVLTLRPDLPALNVRYVTTDTDCYSSIRIRYQALMNGEIAIA